MTVTVAQFRLDFPAFADTTVYPDTAFAFWYAIALRLMNAALWASLLDVGSELFVAHHLALEARSEAAANAGGIPGESVGPLNSKSVDKVSMGYDTSAGIELEAGHWNLTIYGTRYIRLVRMVGIGCVQIGAYSAEDSSAISAWTGPLTTPGFSNF